VAETGEISPNAVVPIPDYSDASLRLVIDRIERSSRFQHYILRADELDDVGRHIDTALKAAQMQGRGDAEVEPLQHLLATVIEAHDLVVDGSPQEAVARLRALTR
jgi:hypothetical protein